MSDDCKEHKLESEMPTLASHTFIHGVTSVQPNFCCYYCTASPGLPSQFRNPHAMGHKPGSSSKPIIQPYTQLLGELLRPRNAVLMLDL